MCAHHVFRHVVNTNTKDGFFQEHTEFGAPYWEAVPGGQVREDCGLNLVRVSGEEKGVTEEAFVRGEFRIW